MLEDESNPSVPKALDEAMLEDESNPSPPKANPPRTPSPSRGHRRVTFRTRHHPIRHRRSPTVKPHRRTLATNKPATITVSSTSHRTTQTDRPMSPTPRTEPRPATTATSDLRERLSRNKPTATATSPRPSADVPLYLPVDRWDLCWRCGYPGHLRGNCTVSTPPRLFCSRCGLYGTMSRHCPCRPSTPGPSSTNPSKVSRGVQCYLYPPYHKLKSRTTGTQWEAQD